MAVRTHASIPSSAPSGLVSAMTRSFHSARAVLFERDAPRPADEPIGIVEERVDVGHGREARLVGRLAHAHERLGGAAAHGRIPVLERSRGHRLCRLALHACHVGHGGAHIGVAILDERRQELAARRRAMTLHLVDRARAFHAGGRRVARDLLELAAEARRPSIALTFSIAAQPQLESGCG